MSKALRRFTLILKAVSTTSFLKQKEKIRNLILEQINLNITEKDLKNISGGLQH